MASQYDIQICTISGQADPNLFSIYDKRYRPKEVYFFVTPQEQMQENYRFFKDAIRGTLVNEVHMVPIEDLEDFSELEEKIGNLIRSFKDPSKVLVNINGGNKLIAIVGSRICESSVDYVYVGIYKNKFIFFLANKNGEKGGSPKETIVEEREIDLTGLSLEQYLKVHGVEMLKSKGGKSNKWKKLSPKRKIFAERVLWGSDNLRLGLRRLNRIIGTREALDFIILKDNLAVPGLQALLDQLEQSGLAEYSNGLLRFKSEEERDFVHGKWLEQYTAEMIAELDLNIEPVNLEFLYTEDHIKNEFDVVFLYKGILHVVEVKTSVLRGKDVEQKDKNQLQDIVHKLNDVSKNAVGIACKDAIVSLFNASEALKKRSKSRVITFIGTDKLEDADAFKEELKKWILAPHKK